MLLAHEHEHAQQQPAHPGYVQRGNFLDYIETEISVQMSLQTLLLATQHSESSCWRGWRRRGVF